MNLTEMSIEELNNLVKEVREEIRRKTEKNGEEWAMRLKKNIEECPFKVGIYNEDSCSYSVAHHVRYNKDENIILLSWH